jgi:HSP20 family protein
MARESNPSQSSSGDRLPADHWLPAHHTPAPRGPYIAERLLPAVPPIEAWIDKEDNEYHLSIAVPGIDPKDLQLHVEGRNLTVQGEHETQAQSRDAQYLHREFRRQSLQRTITLPDSVDTERLTAKYENGVLEITAPLKESATSKQIQINAAQQAKRARA